MKRTLLLLATAAMFAACAEKPAATLKEAFENDFYIGTAMNVQQIFEIDKAESELVARHFSAIVAENCMKSEEIHPEKNRYFFDEADAFVAFGEKHGMFITGHTLVWHSQLAPWFPYNEAGEMTYTSIYGTVKAVIAKLVAPYDGKTYTNLVFDGELEDSNKVISAQDTWSNATLTLDANGFGFCTSYPYRGFTQISMVDPATGRINITIYDIIFVIQ